MNKGRLWPLEEIENNKDAYVKNIPLHKEEVEELMKKEESQK